jgi:hypothetical protein
VVHTLSKEHEQQLFEKKVLKKTFRSKSDKVGEQFRILDNEERRDLKGSASVLGLQKLGSYDGLAKRVEMKM